MAEMDDVVLIMRFSGREVVISFPKVDEWLLRPMVNLLRDGGFEIEARQRTSTKLEI